MEVRKKKAKAAVTQVLSEIGVPLEAIVPPVTPSAVDVIGLTTAERERFRTGRGIHLPCEQTIIQCKKLLRHMPQRQARLRMVHARPERPLLPRRHPHIQPHRGGAFTPSAHSADAVARTGTLRQTE
jgi:hypothetical protein